MYYKNEKGKIYYQTYGREDAPAIVLLHGVAMDHKTFEKQVDALQDQYRAIVIDFPYHGKSSSMDNKLPFSETAGDLIMGPFEDWQRIL